jgi:hypothetical protein
MYHYKQKINMILGLYCKVLLLISLKQVHINVCLTIMVIGLRFYYLETVYASWYDETLFQVIDASKIDKDMGYDNEYKEIESSSSFNDSVSNIEVALTEKVKENMKTEESQPKSSNAIEYESHIGTFLGEMGKEDPEQLKTILKWYMESGLSLNKEINHCTKIYIKFIADLGLMCYENKVEIGDEQTTAFLVIGSYHTEDPELYNIARAYIHLAYYNQDLNNEVKMSHEVFNKQFTNATLKIEEIHEYLRKNKS